MGLCPCVLPSALDLHVHSRRSRPVYPVCPVWQLHGHLLSLQVASDSLRYTVARFMILKPRMDAAELLLTVLGDPSDPRQRLQPHPAPTTHLIPCTPTTPRFPPCSRFEPETFFSPAGADLHSSPSFFPPSREVLSLSPSLSLCPMFTAHVSVTSVTPSLMNVWTFQGKFNSFILWAPIALCPHWPWGVPWDGSSLLSTE